MDESREDRNSREQAIQKLEGTYQCKNCENISETLPLMLIILLLLETRIQCFGRLCKKTVHWKSMMWWDHEGSFHLTLIKQIIWSSDAWKRGDNCDENEEIGHREWKKWGIEQTKLLKNPRGSGLISPQCRVEQGIQIKTFMLGFCITYQRSCYLWWKFFV